MKSVRKSCVFAAFSVFRLFPPARLSVNLSMRYTTLLLLLCLCVLPLSQTGAWGFWAHRQINRVAVFTLPDEMFPFFRHHVEYLTKHATDPDSRRSSDPEEAPRHYIDLDYYGPYPFDSLPRSWQEAVARYTEDTLKAYGIVPWHIQRMYYRLVEAYKAKDKERILKLCADLGHYVADAHVPLHATLNYNGQLTNQHGIHSLLESRLPELFHAQYDFVVGPAPLFANPLKRIWEVVLQSAAAVDTVLSAEWKVRASLPEADWQVYEERNGRRTKMYSEPYAAAYHAQLNGLVERRMRQSILAVGSFWYSAWVDAGQPELSGLINTQLTPADSVQLEEDTRKYRLGMLIGRPEAD